MTTDFQGRSPEHQASNETCCEVIFIAGGLLGMFAVGFFIGQFVAEMFWRWV